MFVPLQAGAAAPHGGQGPFAFEVTYAPDVHPGPISARVDVMLVEPGDREEPRRYDDWFHPRPVLAVGARDRRPGEPFRIGPIDRTVAPRRFKETGRIRLVEVPSPLGPDGRPRPLWDRTTGAVDPEVARSWGRYDIRLVLEGNWAMLGPRLAGKLHVFADSLDTFYLEGAVKPLEESLARIGGDAVVEVVPGEDHFSLIDRAPAARFDREMREAVGPKDDTPSLPTR